MHSDATIIWPNQFVTPGHCEKEYRAREAKSRGMFRPPFPPPCSCRWNAPAWRRPSSPSRRSSPRCRASRYLPPHHHHRPAPPPPPSKKPDRQNLSASTAGQNMAALPRIELARREAWADRCFPLQLPSPQHRDAHVHHMCMRGDTSYVYEGHHMCMRGCTRLTFDEVHGTPRAPSHTVPSRVEPPASHGPEFLGRGRAPARPLCSGTALHGSSRVTPPERAVVGIRLLCRPEDDAMRRLAASGDTPALGGAVPAACTPHRARARSQA